MFQWDDSNVNHIAKHGVTPAEAEQVILNQPIEVGFQRRGEEVRTAQVGETDQARILFVVTTWRNRLIRVVTAFPAKKALRAAYAAQKRKQIERRISEEEVQE
jgi:uncharacterized protein